MAYLLPISRFFLDLCRTWSLACGVWSRVTTERVFNPYCGFFGRAVFFLRVFRVSGFSSGFFPFLTPPYRVYLFQYWELSFFCEMEGQFKKLRGSLRSPCSYSLSLVATPVIITGVATRDYLGLAVSVLPPAFRFNLLVTVSVLLHNEVLKVLKLKKKT